MKLKLTSERLMLLLAVLLLPVCFFLPDAVSGITDAQSFNKPSVMNAQTVSFETGTSLSLSQRLSLAANANTESVTLKNGRVQSTEEVPDTAKNELRHLLGTSSFEFDFDTAEVEDCYASFIIDAENPSVSIILWNVTLTDRAGRRLDAALDDETGIVLQLLYRTAFRPEAMIKLEPGETKTDGSFYEQAKAIAVMMAEYYNLPVTIDDYKHSGSLAYYRADLKLDDFVLPLYGVVRDTGFSINERV